MAEETAVPEEENNEENSPVEKGVKKDDDVLKRSLEHAKRERNEAKAELARLKKELADNEEKKQKEKGEFKQLYEKAIADLDALRKEKADFETAIKKREAETFASNIALKGTTDARRKTLLTEQLMRYVIHTEKGIGFEMEGIEIDEKTLLEHLKGEYPFLFDGTKASGSGATGGSGGAAMSKKWEDMTTEDRIKLKATNYDQFKRVKEDYEKRRLE